MKTCSDEQLAESYQKNGDEKALEYIIKRYLPLIFAFVKKYTGRPDDAADITQEVFVKVWKKIGQYNSAKSFRSWLYAIAKNTAIDWLRKKQAIPFSVMENEDDLHFADSLTDDSPTVLDMLDSKINGRRLLLAIAQLPLKYSSIFLHRVDHDSSLKQVAQSLKIPLNTVKSRHRRGLIILKNLLSIRPD